MKGSVFFMSISTIIQIIIDVAAIVFLLYGFINEECVVKMESDLRRIILGNYRRLKRMYKARKNICQKRTIKGRDK